MSSPVNLNKIITSFSKPRFNAYLNMAKGNEELAIKLYIHNSELVGSLFLPLSVTEVTLRNAVDNAFSSQFGNTWYQEKKINLHIGTKNAKKLKSLVGFLNRERIYSHNQVVANLSFSFWVNAFHKNRFYGFWRNEINNTFPNWKEKFPNKKTQDIRDEIRNIIKPIYKLRNRAAHHEPILNMNVKDVHQNMIQLTTLICKETAKWIEQNSKVIEVLNNDPRNENKA